MMVTDKDNERKESLVKQRAAMTEEEDRSRRYQQFLRMSRTESFSEFNNLEVLYRAGNNGYCHYNETCLIRLSFINTCTTSL